VLARFTPRLVAPACVLASLLAGSAAALAQPAADGSAIFLSWDRCYGDGAVSNRTFACDTNSGVEVLYVSARPPAEIPQLNGAEVVIDILKLDASYPDWWQLSSAGGCRPSSITTQFGDPGNLATCGYAWNGAVAGGWDFQYYGYYDYQARLRFIAAIPAPQPAPAQELFLGRITINHAKTAGSGACSSCQSGLCLGLRSVLLTQPTGVGDVYTQQAETGTNSDRVTWQSGAVMRSGWNYSHSVWTKHFDCLSVTDAKRPTWGALKRMYR
jgi:hypothetical protein